FVQATLEINRRTCKSFQDIFKNFFEIDFVISKKPFKQVMWNDFEKTMVMGNQGLTKLLLIYIFDKSLLKPPELKNMKNRYAAAINFEGNIDDILNEIN